MLFIDGKCYYTDGVPNDVILNHFRSRNDRCVNRCCACIVDGVFHQADHNSGNPGDFGGIVNISEIVAR